MQKISGAQVPSFMNGDGEKDKKGRTCGCGKHPDGKADAKDQKAERLEQGRSPFLINKKLTK